MRNHDIPCLLTNISLSNRYLTWLHISSLARRRLLAWLPRLNSPIFTPETGEVVISDTFLSVILPPRTSAPQRALQDTTSLQRTTQLSPRAARASSRRTSQSQFRGARTRASLRAPASRSKSSLTRALASSTTTTAALSVSFCSTTQMRYASRDVRKQRFIDFHNHRVSRLVTESAPDVLIAYFSTLVVRCSSLSYENSSSALFYPRM